MKSITIDLPLPSRELHPNARPHWRAKATAAKKYRAWACLATRCHQIGEPWRSVSVLSQFTFQDKRTRDTDGLLCWLKNAFDGIQDAGVVLNDAGMTHQPVEVMPPNKLKPGVRIIVTDLT